MTDASNFSSVDEPKHRRNWPPVGILQAPMVPPPLMDVFFWSLVATATLFVEVAVFTSRQEFARRTYALSGIAAIVGFGGPRALIPFLPQPSLGLPPLLARGLGGVVFIAGSGIIAWTLFRLRKGSNQRADETDEQRRPVIDDGLYGLVRHPMYLGDVLWALGLAIALNAAYAVALTPLWWALRASLALLEEERLIDKHGDAYRAYRDRVPNRILPVNTL
ncbi:methyltransferase family protein [Halanaeroarchaeum sulfurireducens]|nr:isoprenylcysteine carboxylmethyltransferase family protein [Halanaeroarchaeum sulfurireducens]